MGDSDEYESSIEPDGIEAVSSWPDFERAGDVERVRDHIEEALEVFGTPAYGYVAVTPKSMEDEAGFAASVGIASMMKLLNNYDHVMDEETEEAFREANERLLRFEEARMRMDDE